MTTYSTEISAPKGLFSRILDGLINAAERHARATSRRDLIEALQAKTDEELATLGLRRDQIAQHVYRDLFYV